MNYTQWLNSLSVHNTDASRAFNVPVSITPTGCCVYAAASDCYVLGAVEGLTAAPPRQDEVSARIARRMIHTIEAAAERQVAVGTLDALLLKELVGDPTWSAEETTAIEKAAAPGVLIGESYYLVPVLARALAVWSAPAARLQKVPNFFDVEGGHDDLLVFNDGKLLALCCPYASDGNPPEQGVIELPQGALTLKKG